MLLLRAMLIWDLAQPSWTKPEGPSGNTGATKDGGVPSRRAPLIALAVSLSLACATVGVLIRQGTPPDIVLIVAGFFGWLVLVITTGVWAVLRWQGEQAAKAR